MHQTSMYNRKANAVLSDFKHISDFIIVGLVAPTEFRTLQKVSRLQVICVCFSTGHSLIWWARVRILIMGLVSVSVKVIVGVRASTVRVAVWVTVLVLDIHKTLSLSSNATKLDSGMY